MILPRSKSSAISRAAVLTTAAVAVAAATALWVQRRAAAALRAHPRKGTRIEVDGVGVHYVERGVGSPVVLLHGNTVSLDDFEACGLLDQLALRHRVIAFDRPGFGHSERPRDRLWTPAAQAELLHGALEKLGVDRPAVVGHSMGTLVALALALNHPEQVRQLVLVSGYYYPTVRVDALLTAPVALPVLGDVLRYTVTAVAARATLKGVVRGMFAPEAVPRDFFAAQSREMMLRPSQIGANAEDAAFMMPAASRLSHRYRELRMPVTIVAGSKDGVVDPEAHAMRLHNDVTHSELLLIPACGHMAHDRAGEAIAAALANPQTSASGAVPDRWSTIGAPVMMSQ